MPTSSDPELPPLLVPFLELAVSTAYSRLQARGGPTDDEIDQARAWGEKLPEVADLLVRSSKGAGQTLASTARALAVLLWCAPQGQEVSLFGVDWRRP